MVAVTHAYSMCGMQFKRLHILVDKNRSLKFTVHSELKSVSFFTSKNLFNNNSVKSSSDIYRPHPLKI